MCFVREGRSNPQPARLCYAVRGQICKLHRYILGKIALRFWRLDVPLSVLLIPAAPRTNRHLGCGAFKELDTARFTRGHQQFV